MDRNAQLAAKAAEVTDSLRDWTKEILRVGEQLVVTFRVQVVPSAVVEVVDESKQHLLSLNVLDFFTQERLGNFREATRIHNCLRWGDAWRENKKYKPYKEMTLSEFLEEVTEYSILRTPNLGRKSLRLLKDVLASEGFSLRH